MPISGRELRGRSPSTTAVQVLRSKVSSIKRRISSKLTTRSSTDKNKNKLHSPSDTQLTNRPSTSMTSTCRHQLSTSGSSTAQSQFAHPEAEDLEGNCCVRNKKNQCYHSTNVNYRQSCCRCIASMSE